MKRKSFAKRRDANEAEIVEALLEAGATFERLDWCDLLVGYLGMNYLLEVKTSKGKLTKKQSKDFPLWNGRITVVRTTKQALEAIGVKP